MPATIKAQRPIKAKDYQIVQVSDLTGGVNLRVSPTLLTPDQARQLRNVSLEEPGAWIVRPGYLQFSSGSLGASRGQGGQRVYLSSHTFTLFAHNSSVYLGVSSLTSTSASVLSGLSTNQVFFPYDRDIVICLDASTNGQKKSTDGSTWTRFGIEAPTTIATASTLSSGACSSGEYEFAHSFKDRSLGYESNISSGSTVTLTGSTGAFHLEAGSTSADAQVDAYVWYAKDKSAGESVFRKVSSGAASTVRITDTNWTANDEAPTNHDVPPTAEFGTFWKNRLWLKSATVGNRLHFSEVFLPQAFPATFYLDIPFSRGDTITAHVALGDFLVVWGQSGAFIIIGHTSLDFEVRPAAGGIEGNLGPRSCVVVEQGILHASAAGIGIFDGATDKLLSYPIEPAWRDYVANASQSDLNKTPMVYQFASKEVRIAVTRVYPRGTAGEWVLNLDRSRGGDQVWSDTDRTIGGYIHFDGNESVAGQRGDLLTWHSTSGLLFKESTGTTANSSNMVAEYEGPGLAMGLHRARVIDAHVEYEPHAGSFAIEPVIDGVSQGAISLSIGSGLAQYGTGLYGTATYGGSGRRKAYTMLPLASEGRVAVVKGVYTGQERFRWFTYALGIRPETKPRELTE